MNENPIKSEFVKYLNRYFDDYDNDNYERLIGNYPQLAVHFIRVVMRRLTGEIPNSSFLIPN
jgi:hypothetical protein